MKVSLLQSTQDPEKLVAQAAKLCYSASDVETIGEKLTPEKIAEFVRRLIALGHWSALEHASFTFGVEGVSRALTHQLVRHRLASYSQQSQRYVTLAEFPFVIPPAIAANEECRNRYTGAMEAAGRAYAELLSTGIPAEDARYLLPNACETKVVATMNARELRHFFSLRCCNRAQWEIHELADRMLALVKTKAPNLFDLAGPGCVGGPCPEGAMTCGRAAEVRKKYREI